MQVSLKAARINAGLTQTDLALELNVNRKTIGSWESGKSMPTADKLDAICAILGRSYDEIKWRV